MWKNSHFYSGMGVSLAFAATACFRPTAIFEYGVLVPIAISAASIIFLAAEAFEDEVRPERVSLMVFLLGMSIVLVFARHYQFHGFRETEEGSFPSFGEALYFSVVTWTTLGFGDLTPTPAIRPVAALQALLGYVFLGVLVGSVGELLKTKRSRT